MTMTRRLAAILAADVAGYSRLMAADEAGTLARFNALRAELIDPKIAQFKGRVVGTAGDSLLVEFASAVDAVQCAVEVQERLAARNAEMPEDRRMAFRMGVNLGDVIAEGATIHGDGVNVASRLERLAEPGAVVVGRGIHDQVRGKLPYAFADLGEHPVKNIAEPVRAFAVSLTERSTPAPVRADDLPLPSKPSVAVLPFTNMSGDPEQEYFSDGITEDIITELSRNRGLFVIARNSSFMFKGPAVDIAEVGRKLGVRYVVEGSVRKAGKRIRVTAQLVEAATGNHVWAERYDRDLEDIFAVQDEVTERIVWALAGNVTRTEMDRSKRRRVADLKAYDLILRGMDLLMRSAMEEMDRPAQLFEEAARLDPASGKAMSWLALALYSASWELGKYDERMRRAVETAMRAMELDDPEDWTESIIAEIRARNGDFETAMVHMNRAMARNPASTLNLSAMGFIQLWYGRADEALRIGEKLRRFDPLFVYWHDDLLAYASYQLGDYQSAMDHFRRAMPIRWHLDCVYIAACLGQLGRVDEAQAMWRDALERMKGFSVKKFKETMASRSAEYREHWLDGLRKAGITD